MNKTQEAFEIAAKKAGFDLIKDQAGNYLEYDTCLLFTGFHFADKSANLFPTEGVCPECGGSGGIEGEKEEGEE